MNKQKIVLLTSLVIFILALTLLFTGSSFLEYALITEPYLPVGTISTWLGMIALPSSIYWGSKEMRQPSSKINKVLSRLLKILLVLAVFWAPISALLAGNLAYNFSEVEPFQGGQSAMRWFWRYSYGLPIGAIVLLLIYWTTSLIKRVGRIS